MIDFSLKNKILKIPEDFFSKASFMILMAFSLSLPFTMLYMAFFWDNMQGYSIVTCGTAAQLLIGLYKTKGTGEIMVLCGASSYEQKFYLCSVHL